MQNMYKWVFTAFVFLVSTNLLAIGDSGIKAGILDLSDNGNLGHNEIHLIGEWEFYWNQLVLPYQINDNKNTDKHLILVPSVWKGIEYNGNKLPATGAASYRIRVIAKKPYNEMAIKLGSLGTAFKLYVGDKLIEEAGVVSLNEKDAEPGYKTGVYLFNIEKDTTEIIFQISNFHYSKGGIWNNFNTIGEARYIQRSWNMELQISLILVGAILIFALYHLGLYLLNRNFRYTLYFALFCIVILFRTLVVGQVLIIHWFPNFSWEALVKIEYLTLVLGTMAFSVFIYKFFEEEYSLKFLRFILTVSIIQSLIILSTSTSFFTKFLSVYQINVLIASVYILFVVIKAIINKRPHVLILLVGFLILLSSIVNDILYTNKIIDTTLLTSFGFIAFIFSQAYMLSARFSQLFVQTKSLAHRLEATNLNLEKLVDKRTSKIQEQNALLQDQKNQILSTNDALEQQNDEIIAQRDNLQTQHEIVQQQQKQITGSINYASRIQGAVLDSANEQHKVAPNSFVLFHPKDIVSGDFYWFREFVIGERRLKIAAVVDCTGHGVPGAFMSILGAMFLTKVVNELTATSDAAEILNKMRFEVKNLLNQQSAASIVKDGMDMALVIIDYDNNKLHFAGAHNSLFRIPNNAGTPSSEIEEIKGDKMPIGIYVKEKESFTNHTIEVNEGDLVYLFTDGYYDQFGGEHGMKLMKKAFKELIIKYAHLALSKQKLALEQELFKWRGDFDQIDDVTVVGIRI